MNIEEYINGKFPNPLNKISYLTGGRNNKLSLIEFDNGEKVVLKEYFSQKEGINSRFLRESSFYSYIKLHSIKNTPELIYHDKLANVNLFTYISGRKILDEEINSENILKCADFLNTLNQEKRELKKLPIASDACFDKEDHINDLEKRFQRFKDLQQSGIDKEVYNFIFNELYSQFQQIKKRILNYETVSIQVDKILSPSDFGFHNILIENSGLTFLDFEYGGVDSPYKLICDFFSQPDYQIELDYLLPFIDRLTFSKGLEIKLVNLYLQLYVIKWSLIILNDFLKDGVQRRDFAGVYSVSSREKVFHKANEYFKQRFQQ